jgi:putative peptidoglycan lipid II flippase
MNLKRVTLNLSIINTVSISLGFIFHIMLGRRFGISWELDCLFAALAIFGLLGIFNTFITSLFIPVFNEIKHKDEKDGFIFADVTIKWVAVSSVVITLLVWLSGDLIVRVVASGFKEEHIALTLDIIRILLIALIFSGISNIIVCILNALFYFALPAVTSIIHPILNIVSLYMLTPLFGIKTIAISYIISNFVQMCILFLYLLIKTPWRPTFRVYHNKMPSFIKQSSKMTASGLIWSLRDIISKNIASHLAPGSIALLAYAEKIVFILLQISVTPPSKVFYSRVSEWIIANQWTDVKDLFDRAVRVNVALMLFISSGVIIFLVPFLNILFLGSKFIADDITILFYLVLIMLIYLVIASYETYLYHIVYALKKTNVIGVNATVGVVVFFLSAWLLSQLFHIYGLAISVSVTQFVVCWLYYYFIKKQIHVCFKDFVLKASNGFIIAFFFTVIGIAAKKIINNDILAIILIMPVWVASYFTTAKYVMLEERKFIGLKEILKNG